ncbi:MAG: hypothetical protein M1838_002885 [Thelocarpon superellum]|nr:MAG: hypothetical protein M1838_002885 [Thelocarpon superellum]
MLDSSSQTAIAMTFCAFSTIIVAARLLIRLFLVHNPGPDDFFIVVAWVFAVTFSVYIPIQISYGMGKPASTLTREQYRDYLEHFYPTVIMYTISINVTKVSILQQYLRFLVKKPIRRACWALMWLVVLYATISVNLCIFTCTPVSYFWTQAVDTSGGHCMNELGLWLANAFFNIISDIAILVLPMKALYQIHLPRRQKLALIVVFAMGFIVCCISLYRLQSIFSVSNSPNVTESNVVAAIMSTVESHVAIICASLPALRPLVSKLIPGASMGGSNGGSHSATRHSRAVGAHHIRYSGAGMPGGWSAYPLGSVQAKSDAVHFDHEVEEGRIKVVTVMAQETGTRPSGRANSDENVLID